jgi:hypothetical protein
MSRSVKDIIFALAGGGAVEEEAIVVTGSPRSGTTWFLELLRTLPGYKAMNEPLMYEEARIRGGPQRTWFLLADVS